jgi:hypothetical protein
MIRTALRPYVTTGIAFVGASVIAVAPVTVPPPDLPAVDVAANSAVRSVTTDVELTASLIDLIAAVPQAAALIVQVTLQAVPLPARLEALVIALANAGVPAVTETIKLFTETIPTSAQTFIAAGKFAHVPVLAVQAAYLAVLTPPAQFLSVLVQELPLPFGTPDGLIDETFKLVIQTPGLAGLTILGLLADVIDSGLSPVAALSGTIDALSTAFTSAAESVGKIVAALGGTLPLSVMAKAEGLDESRAMAAAPETPAVDDANMLTANVSSSTQQRGVETVTVTVDTSASPNPDHTGTPPADKASNDESGEDVTSNGATDLSDGNMAEPGTATDDPAGEDEDGPALATEQETTDEGASADPTTTTTDSSTGSNEGSGDDGNSAEE